MKCLKEIIKDKFYDTEDKTNRSQGQDKHLPDAKKNSNSPQDKNKEKDQRGGTKGNYNM